jgi:hypothetical protein
MRSYAIRIRVLAALVAWVGSSTAHASLFVRVVALVIHVQPYCRGAS